MSTNDSSAAAGNQVAALSEVKQRRRLQTLLYTRNRVRVLAAEHRSHRLDDAIELYALQLKIEQVIADEFPAVIEAHFAAWALEEISGEHHPDVLASGCSMCAAITQFEGDGSDPSRTA